MEREQIEFLISQYHDGTLSAEQKAVVEEMLRSDPPAQALLNEFQKLDGILRDPASGEGLPAVRWDRLAEQISGNISDEISRRAYRIGPQMRAVIGLALAASVLIGLAIFWPREISQPPSSLAPVQSEIVVVGPQAEASAEPAVLNISVGRPQEAEAAMDYTAASVVVEHSQVALDANTGPGGRW